jgi:hypothetical protein
MEKKIPLWAVLLLLLLVLVGAVLFGWVVQHKANGGKNAGVIGEMAHHVANFPNLVSETFSTLTWHPQRIKQKRFGALSGLTVHDPKFRDTGYLLLSRYDDTHGQSVVELLRLADAAVLYTWIPDIDEIISRGDFQSEFTNLEKNNTTPRYLILHPMLMPDGGLVFHGTGPLVKIDACANIEWMLKGLFHHSIELAPDGNIWVPTVIEPSSMPPVIFPDYRDDSIALVSPGGRLLSNSSVSQILLDNGYRGLLLGAGPYDIDAVHLNDIDPAWSDGRFWKRGDLLLSLRNRSTVFIYRPSSGKIIWSMIGPWLNQHDPDFVGDYEVSVFGNDIIAHGTTWSNKTHAMAGSSNQVYRVDLNDDSVTLPYEKGMQVHEVLTMTAGRSQVLENDDVVIEETDSGRLLRMTTDGALRWSYVNRSRDGNLYLVSWSRYLTDKVVEPFIGIKETFQCR